MMQEVFPLMDEPKTPSTQPMNISSPLSSPSLSTSSSPSLSNHQATQEPLRCPRCDSTNTKFCYYNNYNLTQPRHFCKTCRRYWTKGGALRNVPIGGGCRKAKVVPAICTKSTAMKTKTGIGAHELSPGPIAWAAPHTAQLMALLRATSCMQNPNPSLGVNMSPNVPSLLNGLDNLYGHGHQFSYPMQQQRYQSGMVQSEQVPFSGTQEMFQRFKANVINDQLQAVVGNVGGFGSPSTSMAMATGMATNGMSLASSLMEPSPLNTSDLAYDLQAINGVFP
ncbi:hypothetical protein LUZ63_014319 [Rhynchospora breviuscula]|uniref:Dof zinc finger protein n=1 Tax=Rhynchospora breviuscula TaxID=2022672 RepID=A0A9Q0HLE1_9POAL|nr:hypothetical protein LUZ63_014319 [Rhynchospora breviuscula]